MSEAAIPSKPASNEAAKKSLIDAIIDVLAVHDALLERAGDEGDNGSFEIYIAGENTPVLWTRTLLQNGAGAKEETVVAHGLKSYKFTRVSGASNGGGYLESSQYISIGELMTATLRCFYKSTAALKSKIEIIYYNAALSVISTVAAATIQVATDWRVFYHSGFTPGGARYAKIRLTGGTTDVDVAGSAYFDGLTANFTPAYVPALPGLAYHGNPAVFTPVFTLAIPIPASATTLAATVKTKQWGGEDTLFRIKTSLATGSTASSSGNTSYAPVTSTMTIAAGDKGTIAQVAFEITGTLLQEGAMLAESDFSGGFEANISIT